MEGTKWDADRYRDGLDLTWYLYDSPGGDGEENEDEEFVRAKRKMLFPAFTISTESCNKKLAKKRKEASGTTLAARISVARDPCSRTPLQVLGRGTVCLVDGSERCCCRAGSSQRCQGANDECPGGNGEGLKYGIELCF